MSKSFDEIFQEAIKLRQEVRAKVKDTITAEEMDAIQRRQHFEAQFLVNMKFGQFGSSNNALAR